jgi:hypothetical protein
VRWIRSVKDLYAMEPSVRVCTDASLPNMPRARTFPDACPHVGSGTRG